MMTIKCWVKLLHDSYHSQWTTSPLISIGLATQPGRQLFINRPMNRSADRLSYHTSILLFIVTLSYGFSCLNIPPKLPFPVLNLYEITQQQCHQFIFKKLFGHLQILLVCLQIYKERRDLFAHWVIDLRSSPTSNFVMNL